MVVGWWVGVRSLGWRKSCCYLTCVCSKKESVVLRPPYLRARHRYIVDDAQSTRVPLHKRTSILYLRSLKLLVLLSLVSDLQPLLPCALGCSWQQHSAFIFPISDEVPGFPGFGEQSGPGVHRSSCSRAPGVERVYCNRRARGGENTPMTLALIHNARIVRSPTREPEDSWALIENGRIKVRSHTIRDPL